MNTTNRTTCLICGKPIKPNEVYCDEHKEYARRDDKILDDMPNELFFDLIEGIFTRARTDYMFDADGMRDHAEWFFRSEWAQLLSLSKFDPDEVLKQMDEEIKYGFSGDHEDTF